MLKLVHFLRLRLSSWDQSEFVRKTEILFGFSFGFAKGSQIKLSKCNLSTCWENFKDLIFEKAKVHRRLPRTTQPHVQRSVIQNLTCQRCNPKPIGILGIPPTEFSVLCSTMITTVVQLLLLLLALRKNIILKQDEFNPCSLDLWGYVWLLTAKTSPLSEFLNYSSRI